MPKSFHRKLYGRWIKRNINRFRFQPWISKSRKDYFIIRFKGLAPEISCFISKSGNAEIRIRCCSGYLDDIVKEFDIFEAKTSDGRYYCNLCKMTNAASYYPDRQSLWINHIFEALLGWINSLNTDHIIGLFGNPEDGPYGAHLFDETKINQIENCIIRFHTLLRVIK